MQAWKGEALLRRNKQKGSRNQHLQPPSPVTLQTLLAYLEDLFFAHLIFFTRLPWHKCHLCEVSALPGSLSSLSPLEVRSVPAALRGMVQSALPVPWEPDNLKDLQKWNQFLKFKLFEISEMLRQDIKNRKAVPCRIQRIGCCDSWYIVWKYLEASASSIWLPIFTTDPVGFVKDRYFGVQLQVTTNDCENSIKSSVSHCFPSPLAGTELGQFGVSWRFTWCEVIVLHRVDLRQKQSWRNLLFCWFCSLLLNSERFICQALIIGCSYFESSETWTKAPLSSDARKQFGSSASKNLGAKLHKSNSRRCILALSLIFLAFDHNFLDLAHSTR